MRKLYAIFIATTNSLVTFQRKRIKKKGLDFILLRIS